MIRAKCSTMIDKYRNRAWPKKFAAIPRVGDYVEAVEGHDQLPIIKVVHCVDMHMENYKPYIRVILGGPQT